MTEAEERAAVVAEARSWIGTPYISNGMVKGKRGGTDCAMLLLGVYGNCGLVPKEFDPRPYPSQWHIHRNEEKYLEAILRFAREVDPPDVRKPLPGDVVIFKIARAFSHGAIVTDWPNVIHAMGNDRVMPEDISLNVVGKRALSKVKQRTFTLWP